MALDMNQNDPTIREMCELGRDVLESRDMQALRTFHQHGVISRYEHCLSVCYIALRLADKWHVDVDRRSMVRGALRMISSCMTGMIRATCACCMGLRMRKRRFPTRGNSLS